MGGNLMHHESVVNTIFLTDVEFIGWFHVCGWQKYFLKLTEFDEEVATQFTNTFKEGEENVWGLIVLAIEEWIEEVIGFPTVGENYPNEHDAMSSRAQFTLSANCPFKVNKKGYKCVSLPSPFDELEVYIIRYLTCEGRFSHLHAQHFKFLSYVRHNSQVNVPNSLYNMLGIGEEETQKEKTNSVTHHALIKLLVDRSLRDVSPLTWDEFFQIKTLHP